ncbi:MAG TPA: TonB-dependent receptor, partial [Steroidobacteraceae bacterium]|nr:TonB-dependent receptor [Steroidobacteraceae bacterium]
QALYADYSSDSQFAPTPAQFAVPPSNPYVPEDLKRLADSRANPAAIMDFQKRLSELGPRISINEYDVLQVTAGATGAVFDGWAWDAYVQYGENDQTKLVKANALRSRIEDLVFAPDGGVALCGGFDPFGPGSISPECAAYIAADGSNVAGVEQFIAEASLTGALFALPAGDVRAAVGLMHKEDEYFYRADAIASRFLPPDDRVPFVRSDIMGFNASDDVAGEDANTDAYIEVSVPLLAGRTGVESLEFVGGYRHSDYDSAGGVDAYKAELLYRPVDPLSIRASFQQAVRAPSIFELFLPQLPFDFPNLGPMGRFDPCRAGSPERSGPNAAAVEALCLAQGVPADVLPVFDGSSVSGVNGGNPDLGEEQAETYTVGAVFSSPSTQRWFEDLQIAVDWYRIDVEGAVAEVLVDEFTGYCFDPAFNPDLAADNVWCSYFDRDPTTGDMVDAKELLRNVASITAEGVDLQVAWRLDAGPGQVRVSWLLSWLDSFERLVAIGAPSVENAGTIGGMVGTALPEWKSLLTLGYDWNAVSTTLQWRYIDSMRDAEVPEFKVASYDYFDFYATYDFMARSLDGLTLRLGVVNLTDEAPPIYPTYVQANTDPSQYDAFGRRYTVGLTYRF